MSIAKLFSDQLDWFYCHCQEHHGPLRTKKGMIDTAIWVMRQVKRHFLVKEVTHTTKDDFGRMLSTQLKCLEPIFFCHKYTDPLCDRLFKLQDNVGFTEKELYR
jgi:hypothetical protein